MKLIPATLAAALTVTGMLAMAPARAGLGRPVSSVAADQARMKGQLRHSAAAGYTVERITTPGGTLVKEFVSPGGTVFAVSWRGPVMPDLAQVLGTRYFAMLKAAQKAKRLGHYHLQVRSPQLVVHAGGHMRQFFGVAYVPALVPPNLSLSDLH